MRQQTTRNYLLTQCLAASVAVVVLAVSPVSNAQQVESPVVMGEGQERFEVVPDWGSLPEKPSLGPTHGSVCTDSVGNFYVALDKGEHGMAVFSPKGKFVRYQSKGFAGLHHLIRHTESGQDFLYAAHLAGKQVVKFSTDGKVVWKIRYPKESGKYKKEAQYRPTGIAVASDLSVYVADGYGQNWIHQFDKDQKYVKSFGGLGTEEGKFRTCHSVAVDTRGGKERLLVCDRENRRLQHFDLQGKFLSVSTTGLRRPCCLSFYKDQVAVAELEGRVTLLDGKNKVTTILGDNKRSNRRANYTVMPKDWDKDQFNAPHGLCFSKDGDLVVLEWNRTGRVVFLKRKKK